MGSLLDHTTRSDFRPVADSSAVDSKRGAEDSANVSRQHFGALPFASLVDCVFRTNIAFH